jgi:hypothetical protein
MFPARSAFSTSIVLALCMTVSASGPVVTSRPAARTSIRPPQTRLAGQTDKHAPQPPKAGYTAICKGRLGTFYLDGKIGSALYLTCADGCMIMQSVKLAHVGEDGSHCFYQYQAVATPEGPIVGGLYWFFPKKTGCGECVYYQVAGTPGTTCPVLYGEAERYCILVPKDKAPPMLPAPISIARKSSDK